MIDKGIVPDHPEHPDYHVPEQEPDLAIKHFQLFSFIVMMMCWAVLWAAIADTKKKLMDLAMMEQERATFSQRWMERVQPLIEHLALNNGGWPSSAMDTKWSKETY